MEQVSLKTSTFTMRHLVNQPTARTVSQLRGRADDRAEAPAGGLCRTPVVAAQQPIYGVPFKPTKKLWRTNEIQMKCMAYGTIQSQNEFMAYN